jgi:hypothetical protein
MDVASTATVPAIEQPSAVSATIPAAVQQPPAAAPADVQQPPVAAVEQILPPEQLPPIPLACRCFLERPDHRRPQHTRITSPYCPFLPWPEFRETPCVCFATATHPAALEPHSDVTSPHCPFFDRTHSQSRRSASATAAHRLMHCSSCGYFGHRDIDSDQCPHRVSGRIFQPYVEGSPGRMHHGVEAPTLSERCRYCECAFGFILVFCVVVFVQVALPVIMM